MKDLGIRQGSETQAKPLIIGKDLVYVKTNIEQITEDAEGNPIDSLYSYHEIQYDKDEYIAIITEQLDNLKEEDLNNKLALTEIFELLIM